ncbi:acyclic terpene utilization AtuA family protein [Nocardioides sp. W7]|uniref:acyclic terpene utilization AtuA family protein n=1 Tax=Nocardioides sp. W7 TaxID=2931390 RepID=UPI001FD2978B|nr:acyclic terpene utilization AtuA family protein [Nocardioides sp. W7]
MTEAMRIGNCSGFYGDRLSAMREMLEGGSLDCLTGDYLAELTMLILGKDTLKDPSLGYAKTHLRQLEDCLGLALEKGVRIVSNAGGLNPAGLAAKVRELAKGLGLDVNVAHVEGDDVRDLGFDGALTANAYLGGFGIAAALREGADVVVTGRVTDASLVVGPAVAHHGWTPRSYDELAGAVVAGHVLECGTQATGGNFSGFMSLRHDGTPLGFPLAELAVDGSSVITKHAGTGGAVTTDTVTAQLLYEIQSTRYLNPDVTVHLDSIRLRQDGVDRVHVEGVRGEAPPERLKVCVNELGGYRNSVEFVVTGLDIEAKADWVREQLTPALTASTVHWSRVAMPMPDADSEEGASTLLRCTVLDAEAGPVGRSFTGAAVELALASYPGFTMTGPPAAPTPYGVYRAEYVDRSAVSHTVVHADGRREVIADPTEFAVVDPALGLRESPYPAPADSLTRRVPLGTFVHARSGDKGGDANLGLWVKNDGVSTGSTNELREARVQWLAKLMSPRKVRELIPEAADLDVEVYVLPDLGGVNVLIRGLLGQGVAASTRFDPQAKGLGEWIRSRMVHVQEDLLTTPPSSSSPPLRSSAEQLGGDPGAAS